MIGSSFLDRRRTLRTAWRMAAMLGVHPMARPRQRMEGIDWLRALWTMRPVEIHLMLVHAEALRVRMAGELLRLSTR